MAPNRGVLKAKDEISRMLGYQHRRAREAAGISLRDLSRIIGLSFYCIRRHEAGALMMRTDDLYRSAKAMDCPPARLSELDEEWIGTKSS